MTYNFENNIDNIKEAIRLAQDSVMDNAVNDLKAELNIAYPPASNIGEYPRKRSGDLQSSIIHDPSVVENNAIRTTMRANIAYAFYLQYNLHRKLLNDFMDENGNQYIQDIKEILT